MEKTGLNRSEIHEIYSRYKALLSFECTQIPGMTKESINYNKYKLSASKWYK